MNNELLSIEQLGQRYEAYLSKDRVSDIPPVLQDAVRHMMNMRGKRIRPLLLLESCQLFGGDIENALDVASVIEIFHNFSLVHDDILDDADIRRGEPTVHAKFGLNKAILTGDAMLLSTFAILSRCSPSHVTDLLSIYTVAGMRVVEGEQQDVDFETRETVSEAEYMQMIEYKTSVLLAASLQMGAILANASPPDQEKIHEFGLNLGLAFQIKDDYLDAYGDQEKFGKKIGGDILMNKKTYLLIKALENATARQREEIFGLLNNGSKANMVNDILALYDKLKVKEATFHKMETLYDKALIALHSLSLNQERKLHLSDLANRIYHRDF
jgi:geranylgeranyl diphosphate synthase type II